MVPQGFFWTWVGPEMAPHTPHATPRLLLLRPPVLGEVDRLGEPDVLLVEHEPDEPLQHANERRPSPHLGMEHQIVEAAFRVLALELLRPDLPHVLLAPDTVAGGRVCAEAEVHEVV